MKHESSINAFRNEAPFTQNATDFLEQAILSAIEKHGRAVIGLSGGSTPRPIYEALSKRSLDWSKVWIFLVDDRYIRVDDPKSNQFLIRSTLLKNAPIPDSQIIFPDVSLPLPQCIDLYAKHLKVLFTKRLPDLITLGMGDDGHIASLFPPLSDLALSDERMILHTTTPPAASGQAARFDVRDRISLSLNALAGAQMSVFLLAGSGKKKVWEEMLASPEDVRRWPAKAILEHTNATVFARW